MSKVFTVVPVFFLVIVGLIVGQLSYFAHRVDLVNTQIFEPWDRANDQILQGDPSAYCLSSLYDKYAQKELDEFPSTFDSVNPVYQYKHWDDNYGPPQEEVNACLASQ